MTNIAVGHLAFPKKRNFERKLAKDAKKNSKAFYGYLKKNTGNKVTVGPLKEDGKLVSPRKTLQKFQLLKIL